MAWISKRSRAGRKPSYKVSWRDPDGRIRSETRGSSREARDLKIQKENEQRVGTYRDPNLGKVRLGEFFEHYMSTSGPAAPSSRALYAMHWRVHIEPRLAHFRLNTLTVTDVRIFLSNLREEGVGEATICGVHKLLRRVLAVGMEEDRIVSNPASRLRMPAPSHREMRFLTPSQVRVLAMSVPSRYATMMYLLGYCGLRIGEATALRVKHVDLMHRRVYIEEASKEVGNGLVTGPTKNRQKRSVTLPSFLADMLAEHLHTYSDPMNPDALVFISKHGHQIRRNGFRARVLKPALPSAGLNLDLRTHDLRHTAASIAIKAGFHAKQIQEMLGHSSIRVTLDTYGHLMDNLHGEGAERLQAIFLEAKEDGDRGVDVVPLRIADAGLSDASDATSYRAARP